MPTLLDLAEKLREEGEEEILEYLAYRYEVGELKEKNLTQNATEYWVLLFYGGRCILPEKGYTVHRFHSFVHRVRELSEHW